MCASHKTLEEHHQLQLEKDDRINGRTTSVGIGLLHELTHKREIECPFQLAIEMILWY
jgi:hypothetical protein